MLLYINYLAYVHGNNDFAEIFKNSVKYRSENNFVPSKQLCRTLKVLMMMTML